MHEQQVRPAAAEGSRSALVILAPEAELLVAAYRERYDPSAAQGMPAHITLLYPFLPPDAIGDDVLAELRALFAAFPAFSYALQAIRTFPNVLYLAPQPEAPFRALIATLAAHFPQTPPYGGRIPVAEIVPHLTVAHAPDPAELKALRTRFTAHAAPRLPLALQAGQVWLMDDRAGRWAQRQAFRLGWACAANAQRPVSGRADVGAKGS
jgi:2'-5' RNA ligase